MADLKGIPSTYELFLSAVKNLSETEIEREEERLLFIEEEEHQFIEEEYVFESQEGYEEYEEGLDNVELETQEPGVSAPFTQDKYCQ